MKNVLFKSFIKSYFIAFKIGSMLSDEILDEKTEVVVLQIMPCNDNWLLAEVINKTDYEEEVGVYE